MRGALYAAYLVAFVVAADYFLFWRPFVAELAHTNPPVTEDLPAVGAATPELHRLVGNILVDRASSFDEFPAAKPPGVVRVCAFGDSFTYGDEVHRAHDYPSLLQGRFLDDGFENVEVVNFGSSWMGFHQAFLMWERLGVGYGCDAALLGPGTFFAERDTRFNHTQLAYPYYLHARYVLRGDELELVEVPGATYRERFDAYLGFAPKLRFLRYDRGEPAFVKALLPRGRSLANPFYYRGDTAEEEAAAIAHLLLARMQGEVHSIVLTSSDPSVVTHAVAGAGPGLAVADSLELFDFPYRAIHGHYSAAGNELVAAQYYAQLVGEPGRLAVVHRSWTDGDLLARAARIPLAGPRRPLHTFTRIALEQGGREIGVLSATGNGRAEPGDGARHRFDGGVSSLLALVPPGSSLVDAAWVGLDFDLEPRAAVRLVGPDGRVFELGTPQRIHDQLPLRWVRSPRLERRGGALVVTAEGAGSVSVTLQGRPILRGRLADGRAALTPTSGRILRFAALPNFALARQPPARGGVYELALHRGSDGVARVPLARWAPRAFSFPPPRTRLAPAHRIRRLRSVLPSAGYGEQNPSAGGH